MNVTEAFEAVFELAMSEARRNGVDSTQRLALKIVGTRARLMRTKLDARRRERAFFRLLIESSDRLHADLARLKSCLVCYWKYESAPVIPDPKRRPLSWWNPYHHCTGEFGCAMECLRYKSCEWHPDILKK